MQNILSKQEIRKIAEEKFNKDIFRFADDARIEGFIEGFEHHQQFPLQGQKELSKKVDELISIAEMRIEECKKEDRSCTDDGDNAGAYHAGLMGTQNKFWLGLLMQLKEDIKNLDESSPEPSAQNGWIDKEKLRDIWTVAYSKGFQDCGGNSAAYPNFEEYISSLEPLPTPPQSKQ